uniref:Fe2OG dioxygenase domain-containing protein n=1 Tax=viral metagenome TaxID=1070528 RepID=A0A6C0JHW1_9ZZZZ
METTLSKLKIIKDILPTHYSDSIKSLPIINYNNFDNNSNISCLIKEPPIILYDKVVYQRRNVGFFSNESIGYKFSNKLMKSQKLTGWMIDILQIINNQLETKFNGILINHYENGNNYISAHSDNESGLDKNNIVAALSFGAERKFRIRDKKTKKIVNDFNLEHNSLIIMSGNFQNEFTHEIPVQKKILQPRWSLTFRKHTV